MEKLNNPATVLCTLAVVLLLIVGQSDVYASQLTEMEKPVPVRNVEAVLGGVAEMPCDILPEDAHDDVYLVLWFKENATKPMYSLDVRGKPLNQASHWAESSSLGRRASFRTQSSPNSLLVEELTLEDEGIYRCRVDYRNSPTKNVKLNLTIIVPPDKPIIRDQNGQELVTYEIGPYEVGQNLVLDCEVTGGVPLPKVTWWQTGSLFDSSDEVTRTGMIINQLVYKNLQREDLGKKFVCQAANTNKTVPVSREVKVVLNLKPSTVTILEKPSYVSAGKELEVICQSLGGYPPPKLTWWLGSKMLRPNDESAYNGVSKSTLRYEPTIEDDGRYLMCRAENAALRNSAMEDQWTIQVHYSPQVSLRLGRTLDADNIRTGHDVYFECDVKANPQPLRLEWLHNGRLLQQNTDKGIIMSTQSLVLQRVGTDAVGEYTCRAVNSEGSGESNPVPLKIMFAPICQSQLVDQLIGVTAEESISINCRVDAYPGAVAFSWFFNNSEHREELDQERYVTEGLVSTLNFTPTNNQDYGTLYCLGENAVGHQDEPCAFQIVPTGRPAPLSECRVLNMTQPSIRIGCREGFDGGLPQTFLLEVYENEQLKTKVTNQQPYFEIAHVDSGQPVKLYVFAQNAKGSSEPFIIEETFGKARKHAVEGVTDSKAVTGSKSMLDLSAASTSSIVVIVTGVATGIVFTVLLVCLFVTCRRKQRRPSPPGGASPTQLRRKSSNANGSASTSSSAADMARYNEKHNTNTKVGRGNNQTTAHADDDTYGENGSVGSTPVMSDLDSSSLLLATRRTSAKGTVIQSSKGASVSRSGGTTFGPHEWHGHIPPLLPPPEALMDQQQQQQQRVPPIDEWTPLQQQHHLISAAPPHHRGQFASVMGGTLGRHHPGGGGSRQANLHMQYSTLGMPSTNKAPYPLYHTCDRAQQKKRVTIVEDNNTESSV